jgi:hypothetical protein
MHHDQANLIRTVSPYRRSAKEDNQDGSTHQDRPSSSKDCFENGYIEKQVFLDHHGASDRLLLRCNAPLR